MRYRRKKAPIFWIMLMLACSGFAVSAGTHAVKDAKDKDPAPTPEELLDTVACFRDLPSSTYIGAVNDQNPWSAVDGKSTRVIVIPRFRFHQEPEIFVYTAHHVYLYDLNALKPERAVSGSREYHFYAPLFKESEIKEIVLDVAPLTYVPENIEVYSVTQGQPLQYQTVPGKELALDRKNFKRLRRSLTAYIHGIVEAFESRSNKLGRYVPGSRTVATTRDDAIERVDALKSCYDHMENPAVRATLCNEMDKLESAAKEALSGRFQNPCR